MSPEKGGISGEEFQGGIEKDTIPYEALEGLSANKIYEKADELRRSGSHEEAIRYYENFFQNPNADIISQCYVHAGISYRALGKIEKAKSYYNRALELNPEDFEAYASLGVILKTERDYEGAINMYTKALEYDTNSPNNDETHRSIANVYKLNGNWDKALQHFQVVEGLGRLTAIDTQRYAFVLGKLKRNDEAEEYYRLCLEKDPNNAINWNIFAGFLIGIRRFEEAKTILDTSKGLNPENYAVYNNYGKIALRESELLSGEEKIAKLREAQSFYETALSKKNNRISTEKLGEIDELLSQIEAEKIAKSIDE